MANKHGRPGTSSEPGLQKQQLDLVDNLTAQGAGGQDTSQPELVDAALQLAAEGFHVFPIVEGKKTPAIDGFPRKASKDPERVRRWWTCSVMGTLHDYNIGISTSRFGDRQALVVVDVDNKDDVHGDDTVLELELEGFALPSTREHHTPTGGRHLIYSAPEAVKQGAGVLGKGVDIRSRGGYIVAPGSVVDAGAYSVANDLPIAPAPQWLLDRCGTARPKSQQAAPLVEVDHDRAVRRAREYLQNEAPQAEAGTRNETAYRVAQRVKDLGVGEVDAIDLFTSWNEHNSPPLEAEELEAVVRNAYAYGRDPVGVAAPEAQFPDDVPAEDLFLEPAKPSRPGFKFLSCDELLAEPRPPDWLIEGYLDVGSLAMVFGESGAMKSFLAIDIGLSVATGLGWHGRRVPKNGAVFYICGEGFGGIAKRIQAWLSARECESSPPFFVSQRAASFLDKQSAKSVHDAIAQLGELHGTPRLVVVDTLARNFGSGNPDATADAQDFITALDEIKAKFGCTVLLVHHCGHTNKDRGRNSYVFHASVDWEYRFSKAAGETRVLKNSKAKDCAEPESVSFAPLEVETSWTDSGTGEAITSVVLEKVNPPSPTPQKTTPRAKTQRVALETLRTLLAEQPEESSGVHVDDWRRATYEAGISASTKQDSRRKAFVLAREALLEAEFISQNIDIVTLKT